MMKSPFYHIRHAHKTFDHFHQNLHHAFVLIVAAMIGMLRGASHILTPSTANRQWGGFVTNDFREQNPSDNNIKYALFGDGTPGSTAYTRLRNTSCIPTNVQTLPTNFQGGTLADHTIYILDSGTYTLTSNIVINTDCSVLIGKGDVYLKPTNASITPISQYHTANNIIIDNIKIDGSYLSNRGISLLGGATLSDITIHNIDSYNNGYGIYSQNMKNMLLDDSHIYNNVTGMNISSYTTINNCLFYNNTGGISSELGYTSINNSQFFNNIISIRYSGVGVTGTVNNTIFYNNKKGIDIPQGNIILHNTMFYNTTTGISVGTDDMLGGSDPDIIASVTRYGGFDFFDTTEDMTINPNGSGLAGISSPITSRTNGTIETGGDSIEYDKVTNPQNGSGQRLLSGTSWSILRGILGFDSTKRPLRYIFGQDILKQISPVRYNHSYILGEYGNDNADYLSTQYIAEPTSSLSFEQKALVDQYFGSGSIYTENRQSNGCSLSAFQIKTLNPGTFSSSYTLEDHTIYILTGGEYRSSIIGGNAFVFNGNCIAIIGNNDTRFTKSGGGGVTNMLYAYNKSNIIIDSIKIDALYYSTNSSNGPAVAGIKLDGTNNNSTIHNIQVYNSASYGIYLGQGSHHNTIINTQSFNHLIAGIHLSYSSNYNVINNIQAYNNSGYGIWFADGSNRNTINNLQAYRNKIGIFGDLTTQENVINRAAIYNNSEAGIFFKNSSDNTINDIMLFNNTIGIKTLYNSPGNKYYGEFKLYDNTSDFEGTNGNDTYLGPGSSSLFPNGGVLTTGSNIASCLYAANPTLSGTITTLFGSNCSDVGFTLGFRSPYNTYVQYMFGLNLYKQRVPVKYDNGDILIEIPSQYDASKYIAEVFAIRDDEPEDIYFEGSGSTQLNTWYTTNVSTASVLNISVPVTLTFDPITTSGSLIISGVTLNTTTGTVNNGDTIQIKLLTRPGYNEMITGTVTIGSLTTSFVVKTRNYSQTPTTGSFAFTNFTSIPLDTFTGSAVTIAGIETGVLAGITFDPITTSGWLEIYSGSTMINSGTTGLIVYSGNQIKAIAKSSSGYGQTITGYVTIGLGTGAFTIKTKGSDITPPTTPTLTYPLSGEELFFITRERVAATDTGSGIEGYVYQIAEDTNFVDIVHTGFIATVTGTMGSPDTDFDATSDTFYRRMQARDRDGNTGSRSNTGRFEAIDSNEREFTDKENANLRTYYDSDEITLEGMKDGLSLRSSVDENGTLYENGTDKGTGTFIQNGDQLYITVRSSSRYDRTVSSVLTIANRELEFNVTTKTDSEAGCTLSEEDETAIQDIFDSLVENYSGSEERYDEFLFTMQSMLEDEIDFTNDCNLQYLVDLINDEIGIVLTGSINTGTHSAPNCKEYAVTFDTTKSAYTSPTFKVITYFANRDSLTRYIDSKNPGDCHINIYGASSWIFTNIDPARHIASNGKIYTIQNGIQGYTSSEFTSVKYFSTISALRNYIDSNNPPHEIWSHQVDTSFSPQNYIAPNGKEYLIYHTNRGYMSYKLLKVRYFSTLEELQAYISKNNPR